MQHRLTSVQPADIAKIIAASAFFGMVVICPLVMVFLRHQRLMTELFHGKGAKETLRRLEAVERELRELKALRHEQMLYEDDERQVRQRVT